MAYNDSFLGFKLPLPIVRPTRAGNVLYAPLLTDDGLALYDNYAVFTDTEKRSPVYATSTIDQKAMKKAASRSNFEIDTRIGAANQLDNSYYGHKSETQKWDRGHMAMREAAAWGANDRAAQKASDNTYFHSNACIQHAHLNQDEWVGIENWVNDLHIAKDGKIVTFSGPVYGDTSRTIRPAGKTPAEVPMAFFKVVVFVNNGTENSAMKDELDVRAFLVFQDQEAMADKRGRQIYNYQHYQVTIKEIEDLSGLDFPDEFYEKNPLFFHPNDEARNNGVTSFPERVDVNMPSDIVHRADESRVRSKDDDVGVYILAAQVKGEEWISLMNLESGEVDLKGWILRDAHNRTAELKGRLKPGEAKVFSSDALKPLKLADNGGLIILYDDSLDADGNHIGHIDRVDYTKQDVRAAGGGPILFLTYRT